MPEKKKRKNSKEKKQTKVNSLGSPTSLPNTTQHIRDSQRFSTGKHSSETASVVWWSEFLATDPEARVRFPALPEKKNSGSGTGSAQPREYN
jgi:hypothetical protein